MRVKHETHAILIAVRAFLIEEGLNPDDLHVAVLLQYPPLLLTYALSSFECSGTLLPSIKRNHQEINQQLGDIYESAFQSIRTH